MLPFTDISPMLPFTDISPLLPFTDISPLLPFTDLPCFPLLICQSVGDDLLSWT
jgi:hypothetical protein